MSTSRNNGNDDPPSKKKWNKQESRSTPATPEPPAQPEKKGGDGGRQSKASGSKKGKEQKEKDNNKGSENGESSGCLKALRRNKNHARAPRFSGDETGSNAATGSIMLSRGADANIVRSGHQELDTLYASNDVVTGPITVNVCNAPNNSTVQCGCENINCPFCNLMLSIEKTDPSVLQ